MQKMVVVMCIISLLSCCVQQDERKLEEFTETVSAVGNVTVLQENGGRVSWLHSQGLIAFDKTGDDGYCDVYVMGLDGSGVECLTCNKCVPQLHNGNPEWHPSGEYIVFQAQNPDLKGLPPGPLGDYAASPGVGINNNVWVMTADGLKFWQLTHVKNRQGVLHPHFSPDGTRLLWGEFIRPHMVIKLADFAVENGEVYITNVQTFQPRNLQMYETHGFSPDGTQILFSGTEQEGHYYDMEIYVMDLTTGVTVQLTDNDEWDEHAHFTPDGQSIVWVSSEGILQERGVSLEDALDNPPKLEYWIMNKDGSGKCRLSGFNYADAPEYIDVDGGIGLGDYCMGSDGKTIVAKMRRGSKETVIVLIEFDV
jgi:Tol biopolymer transport system component